MNINLVKSAPTDGSLWANYGYQEDDGHKAGYIDIRAIVQANADAWLSDLSQAHALLSKDLSAKSRWWWLTPFSRLDVRPWGAQEKFKPLFFARAILEWQRQHPNQKLNIINAPQDLIGCLADFQGSSSINFAVLYSWLKEKTIFKIKWLKQILALSQRSSFTLALEGKKTCVIAERFDPKHSNEDTIKYFYGHMFDDVDSSKVAFVVLDQLPVDDKFFIINASLSWDMMMFFASWKQRPCTIGGINAPTFWSRFLLTQYTKNLIVKELAVYQSVKKLLSSQEIDTIVYPYEEKGYERALLMACEGSNVKTIGYTPHPQHHLALSMKDDVKPAAPKPSQYAVCGGRYVDFFESWGKKPQGSVHVWGSPKSANHSQDQKAFGSPLKMLLFLSHPDELRVFSSWLRAEPMLLKEKIYMVRGYKSVPDALFAKQLDDITKEFSAVIKDTGDFTKDLNACDLALFNATSAGLMAINAGKLAIHVCLDDLFRINPCFNQTDFVLSCASAQELEKRLKTLSDSDVAAKTALARREYEFVATVFSPTNKEMIRKDIAC